MITYDQDFLMEEVEHHKKRATAAEAQASQLGMIVFLLGMIVGVVLIAWFLKPDKSWELNTTSERPEAVFYYQYWWKSRQTHYIWATNSVGAIGWLPVDGNEINKDATPLGSNSDF
jgi:hypothetical protein